MSLNKKAFQYICNLVFKQAAIILSEDKEYLVETRLSPLAAKSGFGSVNDFIHSISKSPTEAIKQKITEAITTNETSFFRDQYLFEEIRDSIIPEIIKNNEDSRGFKIWCAASSTGQEPYSLAMLIDDSFPQLDGWDIEIIATDINCDVLSKAKSGIFSQIEVNRGLPARLLSKYFKKEGAFWMIDEGLKSRIQFSQINLAGRWGNLPIFDLVLMRNVLIYFNSDTKQEILKKAKQHLKPQGFLLLGTAESLVGLDVDLSKKKQGKVIYYATN